MTISLLVSCDTTPDAQIALHGDGAAWRLRVARRCHVVAAKLAPPVQPAGVLQRPGAIPAGLACRVGRLAHAYHLLARCPRGRALICIVITVVDNGSGRAQTAVHGLALVRVGAIQVLSRVLRRRGAMMQRRLAGVGR